MLVEFFLIPSFTQVCGKLRERKVKAGIEQKEKEKKMKVKKKDHVKKSEKEWEGLWEILGNRQKKTVWEIEGGEHFRK